MNRFLSFCLVLSLTACSSNWQHAYENSNPAFETNHIGAVSVITVDQRPHVIADSDSRNLVGQLSGLGSGKIPVYTTKNATFGTQAGQAICNGFMSQEILCVYSETANLPQGAAILDFARTNNSQRIIVFEIDQWFVEVFAYPKLRYQFKAKIYNHLGEYLGAYSSKGQEVLKIVEFTNPAQNASITAPVAFTRIVEDIMNSEQISKSLAVNG